MEQLSLNSIFQHVKKNEDQIISLSSDINQIKKNQDTLIDLIKNSQVKEDKMTFQDFSEEKTELPKSSNSLRRPFDDEMDDDDDLGDVLTDYDGKNPSPSSKDLNKFVYRLFKQHGEENVQNISEDFVKSVKIQLRKKLDFDQTKNFKDIWSNALAYRRNKLSQNKNKKFKTEKK